MRIGLLSADALSSISRIFSIAFISDQKKQAVYSTAKSVQRLEVCPLLSMAVTIIR